MTDAERKLWQHLRQQQTGIKFRRQFPIGPYILDFVSLDARLNIEIDGGQHAENPADVIRDKFVQSQRFTVLRFWNNDVLANIEGVMDVIRQHLPPPNLPRQAGEEQTNQPSFIPAPPNLPRQAGEEQTLRTTAEIPSPLAGEG
jgi:BirA family transcriptional regulator, biotin operon repressor / biotin---[acetyl-CoA-carboxylase] ligase